MRKVFVVTINYNSGDSTKKLIESLSKSNVSGLELQIIVVDNSSTFNLFDKVKNLKVVDPGKNTGFSGGNNIGIKIALEMGADYILLINNDATVDKDLILKMTKVLENNQEIGAVVPKIYFSKGQEFHKDRYGKEELGKIIWFAGGFIDWKNVKSVHRGMDEVDHGQYDLAEDTEFATGCCVLLRKKVFEDVGFFDEKYFLYYEDSDLSERIRRAGYKIYYIPDAIVYHDNASSTGGSGSALHDYFLTRNQMLFGMTYAPFKTRVALLRQSLKLLTKGREYQKLGVMDYFSGKMGEGRFFNR